MEAFGIAAITATQSPSTTSTTGRATIPPTEPSSIAATTSASATTSAVSANSCRWWAASDTGRTYNPPLRPVKGRV